MKNKSVMPGFLLVALSTCPVFGEVSVTPRLVAASSAHRDALLHAGEVERERIEKAKKSFDAALTMSFKSLDRAIGMMNAEDLTGERLAIAELRRIVASLKSEVDKLIECHEEAVEAASDYARALASAAPVMEVAAGTFAEYARAEFYDSLKADYRIWAETFLAVARKYKRLQGQIGPAVSAVRGNLSYVKQTKVFLDRLDKFLAIVPKDGLDAEVFLKALADYVAHFERLRDSMRRFHEKATEDKAEPDKQNQSVQPSTAQSSDKVEALFAVLSRSTNGKKSESWASRLPQSESPVLTMLGRSDGVQQSAAPATFRKTSYAKSQVKQVTEDWGIDGDWRVGLGRITLRLKQEGAELVVSLAHSSQIAAASGRFLKHGDEFVSNDFAYILRNGSRVDLSGTRFKRSGSERLEVTGPRHIRSTAGTFLRATGKENFHLSRVR